MKRQVAEIEQSRRAILRRSAGVITGVGLGAIWGATGIASAAELPNQVNLYGGGDLYYEIYVTGNIEPDGNTESDDEDHGSFCSGAIGYSKDFWEYTGDIKEIILGGSGTCTFQIHGSYNSSYDVDIFTNGDDSVEYIWNQDGFIYERNNSLDHNDNISTNNDGSGATGYVDYGIDQFTATGAPSYLQVDDSPEETFHWRAYY